MSSSSLLCFLYFLPVFLLYTVILLAAVLPRFKLLKQPFVFASHLHGNPVKGRIQAPVIGTGTDQNAPLH